MRSFLFLPVLLAAVACDTDNVLSRVPDLYGHGEGAISGKVCNPETFQWLEGATVYTHVVDDTGELRDTRKATSDADGNWLLEDLANGTYTVYIQYGSTTIDMFDVDVSNGSETEVPNEECAASADVEVAVITGDFDDFDTVLQSVGIGGAHAVDGQTGDEMLQFLDNPDEMARYGAIFFAGGHLEDGIFYSSDGSDASTVDTVKQNLKDYVTNGGVVFASDWSYDVIEQIWPNAMDFSGGTDPDAAQIGEPGLLACDIHSDDLQKSLGNDSIKMNLDLDAWPIVKDASDDAKVFLRADAPWRKGMETGTETDAPMLVEFPFGDGKIVFTPWRFSANLDANRLKVVRWVMERELGGN